MAKIPDDERRLHAGQLVAFDLKGLPCFKQLVRVRPVLGIEDRDDLPSGKLQCIIQRLRFRLGPAGRHENQFKIRWQPHTTYRGDRIEIVLLADKLDIELAGRPVQAFQARYKLAYNLLFPIYGTSTE